MQNRQPSRPRQGQTIPGQGETEVQHKSPRLPHEHDESADSQPATAANRQIGKLAHNDLAQGRVDTDKGPPMDATYDKVREGADSPRKKFSP